MCKSLYLVCLLSVLLACKKQAVNNAPIGNGDTWTVEQPEGFIIPDDWEHEFEKDENGDNIYMVVEEMPEPPLELKAFLNYLTVVNPEQQGRVVISLLVGKDGTVSHPKILRSVNEELDQEALRIITSLSKWKPGKQMGENVVVRYTLPVNFVKTKKEAEKLCQDFLDRINSQKKIDEDE